MYRPAHDERRATIRHCLGPETPVVFEFTAILAFLTGGDPALLHSVSVLVTAAAAVSGILLVGQLTHQLTGHDTASIIAGLTMLTLPTYYILVSHGIRPKYFTLVFGQPQSRSGFTAEPLPVAFLRR
ncbi:DolP-mannose mannosyltransferase [Halobacteriaceae archaeon GCM10025711]